MYQKCTDITKQNAETRLPNGFSAFCLFFGGENMNLLKKQIAARLKVEELTNALKEIIKVKGQGCNAKS